MTEKVAVIGLGGTGLVSLKNLHEAGLAAVGFDRRDHIGGIWEFDPDENLTSVLKSTRTNISRHRFTFSDFEYPPELKDNFPKAEDIAKYIQAYANHFNLLKHCRLGVTITKLERSKDGQCWDLTIIDTDGKTVTEQYKRVIVCTGPQNKGLIPAHEGVKDFKGKILHSQGFKGPEPFSKQRVIVVGISNTAGDIAADLTEVTDDVYVSHRSGARLVSRTPDGQKPTDHLATRRLGRIIFLFTPFFPRFMGRLGEILIEAGMKKKYKGILKKEWRLLPAPPIPNVAPVMNDYLVDYLHKGKLKSVHGIKRYLDDGTSIELLDGEILRNIDAVIYCTGYDWDYSHLGNGANPTAYPTPEWDSMEHAKLMPFPRLYWGIFSTDYPESLAFIGTYRGHSLSAFSNSDLASSAIAQIWKGNYPIPTKQEMDNWCNDHYRVMLDHIALWRTQTIACDSRKLHDWLNEAAGTGVNQKLGWGWQGWKFWWQDRELYYLLMDGVDTAFLQRLFDVRGEKGRKRWEGARDAILRSNGKIP
ncbi:hypothetical protein H072_3365 [Dactylellina haptotyla CBS 200.50]|uniref:Uncharacterized protein n=1 Tax=Dactylellina haptotyla (strain CBS 200.50) TaxID=1284197 RepID=S8BT03_DACHA|nr:hypothetical protein H072_3365 [Dactylellina haptotyla CBS 200.50]